MTGSTEALTLATFAARVFSPLGRTVPSPPEDSTFATVASAPAESTTLGTTFASALPDAPAAPDSEVRGSKALSESSPAATEATLDSVASVY